MATPCLCGQATSAPTCELIAGPGITINNSLGDNTVIAHGALPWLTWTPTTTNFTLGNAINGSRYLLNGKTLDVIFAVRFGTTSSWTATAWQIGLPAALTPFFDVNLTTVGHVRGRASFRDISAANPFFKGEVFLDNTGLPMRLRFGDDAGGIGAAGNVRQGTPFTFVNGDEMVFQARFEVL